MSSSNESSGEDFHQSDNSGSVIESSIVENDDNSKTKTNSKIETFNSDTSTDRSFQINGDSDSEIEDEAAQIKTKTNKKTMRIMSSESSSNDEEEHLSIIPASNDILKNPPLNYRQSIVAETRSLSPVESDSDLKIVDQSSDDEEEFFPVHQSTIRNIESDDYSLKDNKSPNIPVIDISDSPSKDGQQTEASSKIKVSHEEYNDLADELQDLLGQESRAKNTIKSVNMNALPDRGAALIRKHQEIQESIKNMEIKLSNMIVIESAPTAANRYAWKEVEAQLNRVQPKTLGKKALQTLNAQKALTVDRLEQIHKSLNNCPSADTIIETPKELKVDLMQHQKHALAWLSWRKKQKPSGGILADDMGLGKTLTMIAYTLYDLQSEESDSDSEDETNVNRKDHKYPGGILVVCPASLLYQWSGEINKHVKRGLFSVENYHGQNREPKAKRLAKHHFVITTYTLAMNDLAKNGPLFSIKWRHIILDEAHQIRNHKSQTSVAVCNLSGRSRWALTGTPVHNKELDLYALLKFLRCSPFDDIQVWKRWVGDKTTGGQDRLNMVMSSLILRRTKQQLSEKKMLPSLPKKIWKLIPIKLNKDEINIYQKVLIFSRTLFAQFLHQRLEKNDEISNPASDIANMEYYKMHKKLVKINRVKKIKQHEILVLLLRLRQICCHPSLIMGMLDKTADLQELDGDEDIEDINLLDQLNKLNLDDENEEGGRDRMSIGGADAVGLAEASKNLLNPSNPVFSKNYCSSKIDQIIKLLSEILQSGDKVIIVSQWTSFLNLVGEHLKDNGVLFHVLDGTVPVIKRMEIVESINNPSHKNQILLLSLTAGGVGLNLVGANHLILADLHWNPQLEMQAQDRIFRLGQTKPVNVYKFMATNTIEERIKKLQDNKLNIADNLLTGAKVKHNKLSMDDLKMLFNM